MTTQEKVERMIQTAALLDEQEQQVAEAILADEGLAIGGTCELYGKTYWIVGVVCEGATRTVHVKLAGEPNGWPSRSFAIMV